MKGCRPLKDEEVEIVAKSLNIRDRCLFLLGCKTGFRISELLSLRVKDVWKYGKIVKRVTVRRKNMKKKVESRSVVLAPVAKDAVAAWLSNLGTENPKCFLFKSRQVWPPPGWMPIWRKRLSNLALSPATMTSAARAMFIPAPTAAPFTAATTGRGEWAMRRKPR